MLSRTRARGDAVAGKSLELFLISFCDTRGRMRARFFVRKTEMELRGGGGGGGGGG